MFMKRNWYAKVSSPHTQTHTLFVHRYTTLTGHFRFLYVSLTQRSSKKTAAFLKFCVKNTKKI